MSASNKEVTEPLHCPFCGEHGILESTGDMTLYWVECRNCGAETRPMDTAELAIALWNSRSAPAAPQGEQK